MPVQIKWQPWEKLINKSFISLLSNRDRYLILWGGRGSSKSDFAAKMLIRRCLEEKYFRFLLIRNNYNSIKDSQWQNIKDIIDSWGLSSLFEFKLQPLEIVCINGNKFLARGCDDTTKLKSVKDPTGAWYEEDIPTEEDFITITTSIRTLKASYLQEIFTINPEVEGNFEDNWFWKKFFAGKTEKSFSGKNTIQIGDQAVDVTYTTHHSTYHDNRWLPIHYKAFLEDMARTNPYYYTIYTLGEWGNKQTGGCFYKEFNRTKHTTPTKYNPTLPLHISLDFNVRPYVTMTVWQMSGKTAIQVDEILAKEPNNSTAGVCRLFSEKYRYHVNGLFIYGDPSGRQADTRTEKGFNDFVIAQRELKQYNPQMRVANLAPPVVGRGGFINAIWRANEQGLSILINKDCFNSIMEYSYTKEASDGTKLKEKAKDDQGISYERWGHISDSMDYFICWVFKTEFNNYLRGGRQREYLPGEVGEVFVR